MSCMSQITFLTSSDEHLSDLPPGFRKDDYRSAILSKCAWQQDLAIKSGASAILRGGDFFHVKAANKTTHTTIQMVAALVKSCSVPTYALAGNHDMTNNDLSSVLRGQPLGVLLRTNTFRPITSDVFTVGSFSARVIGVPYIPDLGIDELRRLVSKQDDLPTIAVVHALASFAPEERIQSFFNETIFDYRDLVFPGCPDVYVFGHYHKDQGVVDHCGVKFVNLGSISRGALTFENLERKPKSSLITINSQGLFVEEIMLPCEDASSIFDLDKKRRLDNERRSLDDFIGKLKSDASFTNSLDFRQAIASYPDDLRALALEILEAAEAGVLDE